MRSERSHVPGCPSRVCSKPCNEYVMEMTVGGSLLTIPFAVCTNFVFWFLDEFTEDFGESLCRGFVLT